MIVGVSLGIPVMIDSRLKIGTDHKEENTQEVDVGERVMVME